MPGTAPGTPEAYVKHCEQRKPEHHMRRQRLCDQLGTLGVHPFPKVCRTMLVTKPQLHYCLALMNSVSVHKTSPLLVLQGAERLYMQQPACTYRLRQTFMVEEVAGCSTCLAEILMEHGCLLLCLLSPAQGECQQLIPACRT